MKDCRKKMDEANNKNLEIERQLKLYQGDTLMEKIKAAFRCLKYKNKD